MCRRYKSNTKRPVLSFKNSFLIIRFYNLDRLTKTKGVGVGWLISLVTQKQLIKYSWARKVGKLHYSPFSCLMPFTSTKNMWIECHGVPPTSKEFTLTSGEYENFRRFMCFGLNVLRFIYYIFMNGESESVINTRLLISLHEFMHQILNSVKKLKWFNYYFWIEQVNSWNWKFTNFQIFHVSHRILIEGRKDIKFQFKFEYIFIFPLMPVALSLI